MSKPVTHYLKTWPEHYQYIKTGEKKAEVRFNDRDFKVGDYLSLMEYDPKTTQYSGHYIVAIVTHILEGGQFGLEKGFVMMSISI